MIGHDGHDGLVQNGCRVEMKKGTGKSWTTAFADAMIELAKKDSRVYGLTAAMPDGTGMSKFEKAFPTRYVDTGICESHLTAMAAGMAKSGLRPVVAVYSTFMQRAFDQVWQEVVLKPHAGDLRDGPAPVSSVTTGPCITASSTNRSSAPCPAWC